MQGKLIVKNFGILKNIDIDINDFTVIIGSQAQGKSLIAKLTYYFCSLESLFYSFIFERKPKESDKVFIDKMKSYFNEIFPSYLIEQFDKFTIDFFYSENSSIQIKKTKSYLNIKLFGEVNDKFTSIINTVDGFLNSKNKPNFFKSVNNVNEEMLLDLLKEKNIKSVFSSGSTLIPAGRSYFSALYKNIFSILNSKLFNIDKINLQFGAAFEVAKGIDIDSFLKKYEKYKPLIDLMEELICGKYLFEDQEVWIKNENGKIKLTDSSSGQQEILPIILVLIFKAIFTETLTREKGLIIIEEPEAHLFPESQNKITEMFSLLYNLTENKPHFFITTHSPYILSSLNNLIQANNTYKVMEEKSLSFGKKLSKVKIKTIEEIISSNKWLDFKKLSAYYISNGIATNIMNEENKIIDSNIIDEVSNVISEEFGRLLELEFHD